MKIAATSLIFLLLLVTNNVLSTNIEDISMVICTLTRHKIANILQAESRISIKLAKNLFKICNIKVKSITEQNKMESDMIAFALQEKMDYKETF